MVTLPTGRWHSSVFARPDSSEIDSASAWRLVLTASTDW